MLSPMPMEPWAVTKKSYIILLVWRGHHLLPEFLPNDRLSRVSHNLGRELFTLLSYHNSPQLYSLLLPWTHYFLSILKGPREAKIYEIICELCSFHVLCTFGGFFTICYKKKYFLLFQYWTEDQIFIIKR